jgi:hypothetical protein
VGGGGVTGPLRPPPDSSVYTVRPMFQVLLDESQHCVCDEIAYCISPNQSMTVDQDDYALPDGILL